MGRLAAHSCTTGSQNVTIGYGAAQNATTGQNNVTIGYNSSSPSNTSSHNVTLGNSSTAALRCQVTSITALSDRRDKTDIVDLPTGLDFINKLRPVKFKWAMRENSNNNGKVRAGFIAQDFDKAQVGAEYLDLVMKDNPEKLEARQGHLIPVLVKAIQQLSQKVAALEAA
jgi:hypothetical protein